VIASTPQEDYHRLLAVANLPPPESHTSRAGLAEASGFFAAIDLS
jgi:hypothetical protein